ncbi:hypothetical protein DPMN_045704 [Dreissena polymorpha]|uniref:Uncharacterized protein n=1 Tax=Dreissena polymorpha TaxID=45954 RepID=A0A9D4HZY2_DREPO|nr:hypothetical protein DPMN_045704 [Dreissena polymorpha]
MTVVLLIIGNVSCEPWKYTSSCFGSDVCAKYALDCPVDGQVIVLGQLLYGFKSNAECIQGISDCVRQNTTACCQYDSLDKFSNFTETNRCVDTLFLVNKYEFDNTYYEVYIISDKMEIPTAFIHRCVL